MRPSVLSEKSYQAHQTAAHPYSPLLANFSDISQLIRARCEDSSEDTFLIYRDGDLRRVWTYGEFYQQVLKRASYLKTLSLKPHARIAVAAHNHDETVFLAFACFLMGYVYVPLNMTESEERLSFVIENAECEVLFSLPDYAEMLTPLKENIPCIEHAVIMKGEAPAGWQSLTLEEGESIDFKTLDIARETESLIVYTSGTTGQPKGVVLDHGNLLADAHAITEWFSFKPQDRAMTILPIHHVNGLVLTLLTVFYFGGSTVLNRKFSASNYFDILTEEKCNWGSVVPTILSFLHESHNTFHKPTEMQDDYFLICGAGPLTVELAQRFKTKFGIKIQHGYGLSETSVYSCYLPADLDEKMYEFMMEDYGFPSIGCAIGCNEMDIHDTSGKSVSELTRGEIVVRGQNVMQSYFKREESTEEAFAFGWFRSGDEGFYVTDDTGRKFFFITGRLKELIIRGGVNYAPLEIDEVLSRIPGVKVGLAVGFDNHFYGEEVGAYVVKEEGADVSAEDILSYCSSCMPRGKCPKVVVFGEEAPVTATGKYQRNKLKPLFEEFIDIQYS